MAKKKDIDPYEGWNWSGSGGDYQEFFTCDVCHRRFRVFVVSDDVWRAAGYKSWQGTPCRKCFEKRLGRRLRPGEAMTLIKKAHQKLAQKRNG